MCGVTFGGMKLDVAERGGWSPESETRQYAWDRGRSHPLGSTVDDGGINFAFFSEHATGAQLLLFDEHDATAPFQTITLDPERNRSFAIWHVYVSGLKAPLFYALRVFGLDGEPGRE